MPKIKKIIEGDYPDEESQKGSTGCKQDP